MITVFFRNGRSVALPGAAAVSSEAFSLAITCFDSASRPLGRFLTRELVGYANGSPDDPAARGSLDWACPDYLGALAFDDG